MQIIINAGGTGTRLWPFSTNKTPKQFVPLVGDSNFLKKTYDRLTSYFKPEQIWINTNINFKDLVIQSLPTDFDPKKILTEPEKRDNFAAIISHAAVLAHTVESNEPLIFIHADHLIQESDWQKFNLALEKVANSLETKQFEIITAGVTPRSANTQLGYIEIKPENIHESENKAVKVERFKEKPDLQTAKKFVEDGNFLWNLGYFSFTFESLLKNVEKFMPEALPVINSIQKSGVIKPEEYALLPKIAFDYAIAEKTDSLGVISMDIYWEDIGNWHVASQYIPKLSENDHFIEVSGQNNLAKSYLHHRKIAFVGVSNLILLESEEGILVIDSKAAGDVKKVAEYFENIK
jgi:mannose-1-phosphate guanylyltransferase